MKRKVLLVAVAVMAVSLIAGFFWVVRATRNRPVSAKQAEDGKCGDPWEFTSKERENARSHTIWNCVDGKWVIDEAASKEASEYDDKRERERLDLYWALRTRVLTTEEMNQVTALGLYLVTGREAYMPAQKQIELNAALVQQFKLHLADEEQRAKKKAAGR